MKRTPIKDKKGRTLGAEYTYLIDKGIRWRLLTIEANDMILYAVMSIITPKVLIDGDYIAATTEDDFEKFERLYDQEASKISSILNIFGLCSTNRIDPCLNLDLEELGIPCSPEDMMFLIRRGNIPKHYVELMPYNKTSHRKKAYDKNSFYLMCGSANINYYLKKAQLKNKFGNCPNIKASEYLLRLEVQCMYSKLYSMVKNIRNESNAYKRIEDIPTDILFWMIDDGFRIPSIPVDVVFTERFYDNIIKKHFYKIARKGDYFTLEGAKWMVEAYGIQKTFSFKSD